MLQYLPNALTFSRVLLAPPLGYMILQQEYQFALALGLVAGLTDALDGLLARRLNALSKFGAALDPIADKFLVLIAFLSFAQVGLVPWYLAGVVIARDVIIICGALSYQLFVGPIEFAATTLSKANMGIQIAFCILVLLTQIITSIPAELTLLASIPVLFIAAASGFDYIMSWTVKAVQSRRKEEK